MADLSAKIAKAKQAGYSDAEITAYLGRDASLAPKIATARKAGYGDADIVGHLASQTPQAKADRDAAKRVKAAPDWLRAVSQGGAFGFADELDAGAAALETSANNALRKLTGRPSVGYGAKEAYEAVVKANRQGDKRFAEDRPLTSLGLNIAGGAWVPGAGYIRGSKSLGQAALRSGQVGAAIGAAAGAGAAEGGVKDRAVGAVKGGAVGAAAGAVAPYVARGAQAGARRIGAAAAETVDRVRLGLGRDLPDLTPQQVERATGNALQYVQGLARRSSNALANNPVEMAGKPITAAEAIGRPAVSELGAIARRSGQTGDALESVMRQRAEGMPGRVLDDLSSATGMTPEDVAMDIAARAQQGRARAAPLYDAAYAQAAPDTPDLQPLLNRPSMREAMSRAATIAAEEGRDPTELGLRATFGPGAPRTTYQTRTVTERGALGEPIEVQRQVPVTEEVAPEEFFARRPTMQTLDYVKRGLDDVLEGYRDSTTQRLNLDERGRAVLGTLNSYRDIIAPEGSAYRAALDAGGEPIRLEQAFNGAKQLMSNNVPMRVFEARFGALKPADKEAHIAGVVDGVFRDMQAGRLRLRDLQTPLYRQKFERMLGPEKADQFLSQVANEAQLARTGSRMAPGNNSPTFEFAAADKERDEAMGAIASAGRNALEGRPLAAAMQVIGAPVVGAWRGARVPLDRATRDEVGRLLQLAPSELDEILQEIATRPAPSFAAPRTIQASNALANIGGRSVAEQ